jgi:hypothetical protein
LPLKIPNPIFLPNSFADPDPGTGDFLTPGSGIRDEYTIRIRVPGSWMNNPDHISESLETIYASKYLNSLMRIRDPGWKEFGSGILDKHPGSATLLPKNAARQ